MDSMARVTDGEVGAYGTGGSGTPSALLHPGIADSEVWHPILPGVVRPHRVIGYDAHGFRRFRLAHRRVLPRRRW